MLAKLRDLTGYRIRPLGDGAFVAFRPAGADDAVDVEELDETTWVVQRGEAARRTVAQIGPKSLRTHLVLDRDAIRPEMGRMQKMTGEYLAQEQIEWILRKHRINCVLDVGANVGQYATRLRQHGYEGRIVSFEPVPALASALRDKASSDPNWLVFECGLGEEEGTAQINAVPGTMSSMLPTSEFGREWSAKLNDVHTEEISIRRLDTVYDEATAGIASPRVYLKMDTQGFDLQAFRGAGERIGEIRALQSEAACIPIYDGMPRLPEMLKVYEAAGFEIAGMFPVTFHRRTLRVIEFDMIMVRVETAPDEASNKTAVGAV